MMVYDLLPYRGIWVSTLYKIVSGNYNKNQDPNSNGYSMEISTPMTPILKGEQVHMFKGNHSHPNHEV